MNRIALALAALAAFPLAAAADVSKEDIRKLVAAGLGEEVILSFIRANGPVHKLTADEVVELKQAGASERVLGAMMGAGAPAAAPSRTVERVVEKPVYVPQTTYVYSTPSYYTGSYYYPSYSYGSYYPSYYYPRSHYYSGWYGPSYRSHYGYRGYYGSRVGVSVGWCW